ncbi:MAG: hypothetical protein ABIQ16_23105 [Polyangiaceae bacterium]
MVLNTRIGPTAVAAALGLAALAGAGSAHAITCSAVIATLPPATQAHVIFGSGGSAITPTLSKVAYVLSKATPPIFVFYQDGGGAGAGYDSFTGSTGGTTARPFRYWLTADDVTTNTLTCTAELATGQAVDFATTGGTLALFDGLTLATDVGVFTGPTQGVNLIVPKDSNETSISAAALFFVFGFGDATNLGDATNVIPWTTKAHIFRRAPTAFVQQFLRGAIRSLKSTPGGGNADSIPSDFPAATASAPDTNQGSVDNVVAAASAGFTQETIGFTSGPTADKNRAKVHTLAYQHAGQDAAYWPDSSAETFDKINIRNGHYFLWDTNQFFTKVTGSNANPKLNQIVNPDVKAFIGYFSGELASPTVPVDVAGHDAVTEAIISTGSIPQCAMQVKRDSDFTGLSCYAPPTPCGHFFEAIATKSATGDACTTDAQCAGAEPKCRFNFCEAY